MIRWLNKYTARKQSDSPSFPQNELAIGVPRLLTSTYSCWLLVLINASIDIAVFDHTSERKNPVAKFPSWRRMSIMTSERPSYERFRRNGIHVTNLRGEYIRIASFSTRIEVYCEIFTALSRRDGDLRSFRGSADE